MLSIAFNHSGYRLERPFGGLELRVELIPLVSEPRDPLRRGERAFRLDVPRNLLFAHVARLPVVPRYIPVRLGSARHARVQQSVLGVLEQRLALLSLLCERVHEHVQALNPLLLRLDLPLELRNPLGLGLDLLCHGLRSGCPNWGHRL